MPNEKVVLKVCPGCGKTTNYHPNGTLVTDVGLDVDDTRVHYTWHQDCWRMHHQSLNKKNKRAKLKALKVARRARRWRRFIRGVQAFFNMLP